MNELTVVLPVLYGVVSAVQLALAVIVFIANPNAIPNRAASLLLLLLFSITIAVAFRAQALSYSVARPWVALQLAAGYASAPLSYIAIVAILRPAWLRHRWLYVPIALLALLPAVLIAADYTGTSRALLGYNLVLADLSPETYNLGLSIAELTAEPSRNLLLGTLIGYGLLIDICPGLVVAFVDRKRRPDNARTALLLTLASVLTGVTQGFLPPVLGNLSQGVLLTLALALAGTLRQSPVSLATSTNNIRNLPLFYKLLLGFAGTIVATVLVVVPLVSGALQAADVRQSSSKLQALANLAADTIETDLSTQLSNLNLLTSSRALSAALEERNTQYAAIDDIAGFTAQREALWQAGDSVLFDALLDFDRNADLITYIALNPSYELLVLVDANGALVTASAPTDRYDFSDTVWWDLLAGDMMNSRYVNVVDTGGDIPTIEIAVPVIPVGQTEPSGVIFARYRLVAVRETLRLIDENLVGGIELRTADGQAVILPRGERSQAPVINLTRLIVDRQPWGVFPYEGDEDSLVVISPVESTLLDLAEFAPSWVVVAYQPRSAALVALNTWLALTPWVTLSAMVFVLVLVGVLARQLTTPLRELTEVAVRLGAGDLSARAAVQSRDEFGRLAETLNSMADTLADLTVALESRVSVRTRQLETVVELAQVASAELNLNTLLDRLVNLIRDRFGYYQVSIFLLDDSGQTAIVRESTGEVGAIFKELGHSLRVGSNSVVGWVTANRRPRVLNDVANEPAHYKNPLLPETRSEAALPLVFGGTLFGALDVQSTQPDAFDTDTLATLEAIASQIAIALNNAQQFAQTETRLQQADALQRQYLQLGWAEYMLTSSEALAYGYNEQQVQSLPNDALPPIGASVARLDGRRLTVPISVRGETVGLLELQTPPNRVWSQDDYQLVQAVVTQAGLALENARLLDATRRNAEREYTVGNIVTRVRENLAVDGVLQTAVRELAVQLGLDEVEIRLAAPDEFAETALTPGGTGPLRRPDTGPLRNPPRGTGPLGKLPR